jgi:hypothetical protein
MERPDTYFPLQQIFLWAFHYYFVLILIRCWIYQLEFIFVDCQLLIGEKIIN